MIGIGELRQTRRPVTALQFIPSNPHADRFLACKFFSTRTIRRMTAHIQRFSELENGNAGKRPFFGKVFCYAVRLQKNGVKRSKENGRTDKVFVCLGRKNRGNSHQQNKKWGHGKTGTLLLMMQLVYETENRKPYKILDISFENVSFDENGKYD
ncbi:hypothetical protein [Caldibacillus debilis]|uniref:hypothetical protein n=1 Tax=Caldibacillus debilis TaxID=301148 RepID=UPI0023F4FF6A|nr:hypothetical protein [Caldibacillus debilis]